MVPRLVSSQNCNGSADSPDVLRRNRGRRGLDTRSSQKIYATVQILEDGTGTGDVDAQLVHSRALTPRVIVTTDLNLSKVAELQGVRVLNVNGLAQALRPAVLPGEEISVQVIKDGKEAGQGVAYLEKHRSLRGRGRQTAYRRNDRHGGHERVQTACRNGIIFAPPSPRSPQGSSSSVGDVAGRPLADSGDGQVAAVVVAAGSGERLPGEWPSRISGWPASRSPSTPDVVSSLRARTRDRGRGRPGLIDAARARLGHKFGPWWPAPVRRSSVAAGLRALGEPEWVLVHDGVRPFASQGLIERVLAAARQQGAAIPAVPVTDTLKETDGPRILRTLDRSRLWAAQTPQAFRCGLLRDAHARVPEEIR